MTDPSHGQPAGPHDDVHPEHEHAAAPTVPGPSPRPQGAHEHAHPHTHPHSLMLKLVRAAFFILFITVTLLSVINVDNIQGGSTLTENYAITILAAVVIGAIIVAIDVFTPRKKVAMLFAIFFALMGGLMVTGAFGLVVDLLARLYEFQRAESVVATLKVLVGICVCYLAIAIVLQTQDDFRLVIPYVEFAKQIRGVRPMLLDSSVLIDGRILGVGRTGVLQAPLIVPRFVVNELQTLADSGDRLKRSRGRRGLGMVTRLQRTANLDVSIDETMLPGKAVDQLLIEMARRMPATIVTTDLGLAQVASIQNVGVLNLNDLAASLRAPVATGDRVAIRIVKPGEQAGQGVGYLDDGTMVVVEDAADRIDEDLDVVIGTTLQTAGGRLVFARTATTPRGPGTHQDHAHDDPHTTSSATPLVPGTHAGGPRAPAASPTPQSDLDVADEDDDHHSSGEGDSTDANTPASRPTSPPAPQSASVRPPRNPLGPGARGRPSSRNPRR